MSHARRGQLESAWLVMGGPAATSRAGWRPCWGCLTGACERGFYRARLGLVECPRLFRLPHRGTAPCMTRGREESAGPRRNHRDRSAVYMGYGGGGGEGRAVGNSVATLDSNPPTNPATARPAPNTYRAERCRVGCPAGRRHSFATLSSPAKRRGSGGGMGRQVVGQAAERWRAIDSNGSRPWLLCT